MPDSALDARAIEAARSMLALARRRYPSARGWLYGSHARGAARADSDVDVAIVLDADPAAARALGGELGADSFDLLLETGFLISPLTIADVHWRSPQTFSNPFLLADIRRDDIAL